MMRRAPLLLALGAALSSCASEREDRAPDAASADEQRALLQAAEMLDERSPAKAEPEGETPGPS